MDYTLPDAEMLLTTAPFPIAMKKTGSLSMNRVIRRQRRQELYCSLEKGKLEVSYRYPSRTRHIQVANLISEAIALLGTVSLPPFYVNTNDLPYREGHPITVFANCSVSGYTDVAAPDFVFNGWSEAKFADFDAKARIIAAGSASAPRDDRAFWMGACENVARADLVRMSTKHPNLVQAVDARANYDRDTGTYNGRFKPMEEQAAEYRYLIDVEGFGYSARLKLLLHAARVLLVIDRPYREYFYKDIEPFRHYVPVARDSSDLIERIDWLRSNPAREAEIIREAQHFARTRLTRSAAISKWAKLLEEHRKAGGKLKSGVEHLPRLGWVRGR